MKTLPPRMLAGCLGLAALMLSSLAAHAMPVDFSGRGVFRFASSSGCPLSDPRQLHAACNRIAIDQAMAHAAVDTAARTIVFSSDPAGAAEVLIGDVLLQGHGIADDGQQVPLSLQVLLRRKGQKWNLDTYIHAPVRGKFSSVVMDPYELSVVEDKQRRVVLTPAQARALFADTTLAQRLARIVVAVRPTNPADPSGGDITVALGVGKLSSAALRASFAAQGAVAADDADQTFTNGSWSIELEALSNYLPQWAVQRELFLFGFENHPLLHTLAKDGFTQHDKFSFGALNGKGYLRLNGQEAPFDGAAAAGRAFMQESFMGLILTWRRHMAAPAAARTIQAPTRPQP